MLQGAPNFENGMALTNSVWAMSPSLECKKAETSGLGSARISAFKQIQLRGFEQRSLAAIAISSRDRLEPLNAAVAAYQALGALTDERARG